MDKKLRLGIIGCGAIVNAHAAALETLLDRYEVAAVCDMNPAGAERIARRFSVAPSRIFSDVAQIADCDEVDACLMTMPHHLHYPFAKLLLEHGKHVLVEKPFTHNAVQALELVELAEKLGLQLVVGHCERHNPTNWAIKELIDQGELGDVFGAFTTSLQYLPNYAAPDSGHWLYSAEKAGGGIVISVGVHKLDLLRFLLGEIESVSAVMENDSERASAVRPFEWTAAVHLKFKSGVVVSQFSCYKAWSNIWEPETLNLYGSDGTLRLVGEKYEYLSRKRSGEPDAVIVREIDGAEKWKEQLKNFYDAVVDGKPSRASGSDALATMSLIDAIYESGLNGGVWVDPKNLASA